MPVAPDRSLGGERLAEPPGPPAAGPDGIPPPEPFTVDLPWPPSTNRVWQRAGGGGVRVAPEVRNYRTLVGLAVHAARARSGWRTGKFGPAHRLWVELMCIEPHSTRRRDLDNLLKATLDGLQLAEVFVDDSQVDLLHVRRHGAHPRIPAGCVSVTVTAIRLEGAA